MLDVEGFCKPHKSKEEWLNAKVKNSENGPDLSYDVEVIREQLRYLWADVVARCLANDAIPEENVYLLADDACERMFRRMMDNNELL